MCVGVLFHAFPVDTHQESASKRSCAYCHTCLGACLVPVLPRLGSPSLFYQTNHARTRYAHTFIRMRAHTNTSCIGSHAQKARLCRVRVDYPLKSVNDQNTVHVCVLARVRVCSALPWKERDSARLVFVAPLGRLHK